MLLASVSLCRVRYTTSDVVWISFLIEGLVMRCLKIVVDQTTLLLLSKLEVVAF